ncbi:cell surface glycoprotein CD200 receptor 1-B [Synchiropus picturatus]
MMDSVWIFIVLLMCTTWSVHSEGPLSFELGSYVNLTCRGQSSLFLYVYWNIKVKNNKCQVSFLEESKNTCRDGLYITLQASNQTVLHIPNFSESDVGFYNGELVLSGSREVCNFSLSVTTPPRLSSWLEMKDDKLVAVCKAEGANPAANISWKEAGNSSVEEKRSVSDQFHTTESRLTLPQHYASSSTPVCSVGHAAWAEEKLLLPRLPGPSFGRIRTVVISIFVLAGTFLLICKHREFLIAK